MCLYLCDKIIDDVMNIKYDKKYDIKCTGGWEGVWSGRMEGRRPRLRAHCTILSDINMNMIINVSNIIEKKRKFNSNQNLVIIKEI